MERGKKNIIIALLCCLLVFMGVGYAAFSRVLTINTQGQVSSKWNIKITNVTEFSKGGYVTAVQASNTDDTASVAATFAAPGDYVEFEITIENQGNIDAILKAINIQTNHHESSEEYIKVSAKSIQENESLKIGEIRKFNVRMEFDPTQTTIPAGNYQVDAVISLTYAQITAEDLGEAVDSGCFTVDSAGLITSYNYDCGLDVVVPSTTATGDPIVAIDNRSFTDSIVNVAVFSDAESAVIYDEENFEEIRDILLDSMGMMVIHHESELEGLSLPSTIEFAYFYVDPITKQINAPDVDITSLDLSQATNLDVIRIGSFATAQLTSLTFGENSNITKIGMMAFEGNPLTTLTIPSSVTTIGIGAFRHTSLNSIYIDMTEEEFASVDVGEDWYSNTPVITYKN